MKTAQAQITQAKRNMVDAVMAYLKALLHHGYQVPETMTVSIPSQLQRHGRPIDC